MKWLLTVLGILRGARTRKRASAACARVRTNGGVRMPCGCFLGVSGEAVELVMTKSGPEELLKMLESLQDGHSCN